MKLTKEAIEGGSSIIRDMILGIHQLYKRRADRLADRTTTGRIMHSFLRLAEAWFEDLIDAETCKDSILRLSKFTKALSAGDDEAIDQMLESTEETTSDPADKVLVDIDTERDFREARKGSTHGMGFSVGCAETIIGAWRDALISDGELIAYLETAITEIKFYSDKTLEKVCETVQPNNT